MRHWKSFQDSPYLGAWDLPDDGVTAKLIKFEQGKVGKDKQRKLIIYLQNAPDGKGVAMNTTNNTALADAFGTNDVEQWVGRMVCIVPTTTQMAGKTVECIRVDLRKTKAANQTKQAQREPGGEG